jgi:hypothetical protein
MRWKTIEIPRPPYLAAKKTDSNTASCSLLPFGIAKYPTAIFFKEKMLALPTRTSEEQEWLIGMINRYLSRTSSKSEIVPVFCPNCQQQIFVEKIDLQHLPEPQAICSGCQQCFPLSETVSEFADRIKQRPLDARTTVNYEQNPSEQNSKTLIITVPSRLSGMGKNDQWYMGCVFVALLVLSVLFGGWMIYKGVSNCGIFFEVFDFWTAMKYSTFCLSVMLPAAVAYLIMFYPLFMREICCWTLRIDADEVIVERRNFWKKSLRRAKRNEILSVEEGNQKLFSKEQLTFRYWLDGDPVWSMKHIRLNTLHDALAIPCHNDKEQQWLLRVISSEL